MNENIRKLYQLNRQFLLDRIKTRTKRKEIRISPNKLPDYIRKNAPTVFVLSTGRTGTKLLTDLFSKVKGVKVYHNPSPVLLYTSKLCYESGLNNSEAFEMGILHARYELVRGCFVTNDVYVETNNRITFYAPFLCNVFKNSKFIHLVRNPGSFVCSGLNRGYYSGRPVDEGRITPKKSDQVYREWDMLTQIEKISWLWNETNAYIENFKKGISSDRTMLVRAEDLFNDCKIFNDILRFCNLQELPAIMIAKIIKRPVNRQKKRIFPPYEEWKAEWRCQVRRFAELSKTYRYTT